MSRKHHVRFGGGPTEKYRRNSRQLAGGLPYQAAVAALARHGITPPGGACAQWGHAFVQAQFVTQLIDRRKTYPASLRDTLSRTATLRRTADYTTDDVSQLQAERALRRARVFVRTIQGGGGTP